MSAAPRVDADRLTEFNARMEQFIAEISDC